MIKPNFRLLVNLSDTVKSSDSETAWREFLVATSFFTNHCSYRLKEDAIGDVTKSLQNWTTRRDTTVYSEKDTNGNYQVYNVQMGEIYLADMGLSYELAYTHPVLILGNVGDKVLVVPSTTATAKLQDAYHPTTHRTGNRFLRKVGIDNGFSETSALMLNSIQVISKGRLLERKGRLNENITDNDSVFNELRNTLFKLYFVDIYTQYDDLKQENEMLKAELEKFKQSTNVQ
ncbi:type II toxin-antitoxin system PemK/MazF family toxin [Paenibacillus sp. BAC0078]